MYCYELIFMGYDGECYTPETSWTVKSNNNHEEMQDYVHKINKLFQKDGAKSFFYFRVIDILDGLPSYEALINDLKDL